MAPFELINFITFNAVFNFKLTVLDVRTAMEKKELERQTLTATLLDTPVSSNNVKYDSSASNSTFRNLIISQFSSTLS